jgi:hypothetical protein
MILFIVSITLAYVMFPHWVTLSHFVSQWYTLIPFAFAMLIAIFELWYLGARLHRNSNLRLGANALYSSAVCAALILCVPYTGRAIQKDIHNIFALLFVLFAALGFASIAKRSRHYTLGSLSGTLLIICVLEIIFLVRYKAHPVSPWVWTILELSGIAALIIALYIIAEILEQKRRYYNQLRLHCFI